MLLKGSTHVNSGVVAPSAEVKNVSNDVESSNWNDREGRDTHLSESSHVMSHQLSATADEFIPVKPRKRNRLGKKPINMGTAEITSSENAFAGRETSNKKAWLFISRVKDSANEEIVRNYILKKTKVDDKDVSVKAVETTYKKEDNKCFLIGIKFELKDALYDKDFWPKGVAFRRFRFRFDKQEKDNFL